VPSTSGVINSITTFKDLIYIPHRERGTKCKRIAPPSYHLTSDEHIDFLAQSHKNKGKCSKTNNTVKEKAKKAEGENAAQTGNPSSKKATNGKPGNTSSKIGEKTADKAAEKKTEQTQLDTTACMYCDIQYCQSSVEWIRCKMCKQWACKDCAHLNRRKKAFVCDSCK